MANVGQMKGVRTRAKNEVKKVAGQVSAQLNTMETNVGKASLEEVNLWVIFVGTNLPKLQNKLELLDQSSDKLQTFCQDTNNEVELQRLNAELDAGDDMEEFRDIVYRLQLLERQFTDRKAELKPKVEVNAPVAQQNVLTQADLIAAVTAAMAQFVPQVQQQAAGGVPANVPVVGAHRQPAQAQAQLRVKLPKLELRKFSGDIMEWSGFWAQFSKAIHDVPNFPDIEKFQYLTAHLEGEALKAISGYKFTEANYPVVIALLEDRFGTTQPIIEAYYSALNNMSSTTGSSTNLRIFYDELERNLRSLEALNQDINSLSILTTIRSKLPHDVRRRLETHKPDADVWTVERLRLYLKRELKISESLSQSDKIFNQSTVSYNNQTSNTPKNGGARPKIINNSQSDHQKPPNLRGSGSTLVATEEKPQRVGTHHQSLCLKKFNFNSQLKPKSGGGSKGGKKGSTFFSQAEKDLQKDEDSSSDDHPQSHKTEGAGVSLSSSNGHSLLASDESVIMQTALVKVHNPKNGAVKETTSIFDCGSTHTYVTYAFAKELNLPLGKKLMLPITTFGTDNIQKIQVHTSTLQIQLNTGKSMTLNVRVVPQISGPTHRIPLGKLIATHLFEKFSFADTLPMTSESRTYQLLIGQDYYFDFLLSERYKIRKGLYLQSSKVGWILAGRIKDGSDSTDHQLFAHSLFASDDIDSSFFVKPDSSLSFSPDMKLFWDLETLGIEKPSSLSDQEAADQKFNDTVQVKDGWYEVSFPWKVEEPNLPSNYTLALNRFRSVAKRLAENPDLLKKYDDIIQNQVKLGIIERVNSNTVEGPLKHYVPHHPVEKQSSVTTQVRVVYDASAKSKKDNLSLNECLYPGPSLVKPLCGLLIRIRLHSIGIIADIEKAFLNIGLSTDDRDVTRFFWFKDPTNPTLSGNIQIYRFARIPFGVTSSPFLLASAVNHLLDSYGTTISQQLRDNIYVDNVITGAPDVASAMQIYNESQKIFKSASLNLREWSSNSEAFLQQLPEHHHASGSIFKVLGILWDTKADSFTITGFDKEKFQFISTKREVLQAIASVYIHLAFLLQSF